MKLIQLKKGLPFLILLFLISGLIFIKCKPSRTQEFEIYRFVDNLKEKNIKESPLKGLVEKFNFVKQDLTKRWTHLPLLSNKEQEVWGVSSKLPILGFDEFKQPEGMKLTRKGKEIGFAGSSENKSESWRWLQTIKKEINLRKYDNFLKNLGGNVIREGESFTIEEILPDGEAKFNFHISMKSCQGCTPNLVFSLNNKPVREIILKKPGHFSLSEKINFGRYDIGFSYKSPENRAKKKKKNFIVIKSVDIETQKDIILLTTPKKEDKSPPAEKYQAVYYSSFSESEGKLDKAKRDALFLCELKEKYPIKDLGISQNPYSIIQKPRLFDYSLNCLFAPPKSHFAFEVKIPERCTLEFGYGFLMESFDNPERSILFKVEVEDKKKKEILLSEHLKPSEEKKFNFTRIEMFPYQNKKVKIHFTTENIESKNTENQGKIDTYPLWINPFLHRKTDKEKINFILLLIDTLRADHLGCYGYSRETSPNLDELTDDAVLFENVFSTTSWTLPAHVSLLTSLNNVNHQVLNSLQRMSPNLLTLADIMRNNDYLCAAFTGGGYLSCKYGFSKGFDIYQEIIKNGDISVRFDEAESLSRRAAEWLDENHYKSFFLFLHTYQPHAPYENNSDIGKIFLAKNAKWQKIRGKDVFRGRSRKQTVYSKKEIENIIALYDGEIRYTDECLIKPMIDKIKELNIYDKTMIIITSDHGEEFYEHKNWLHGLTLYNESIKIPLIVKLPDSSYKGKKLPQSVRITDIMPTLLEAANIDPTSFIFDGKSLLSMINGREREDRTFYCDLNIRKIIDSSPSMYATNKNSLKFILNKKIRSSWTKKIVTKLEGEKIELYDIKKDTYETENLSGLIAYEKICRELIKKIKQYMESGAKIKAESIKMDEELRRSLKALGYIR